MPFLCVIRTHQILVHRKEVSYVGDLIIRDESTGESRVFTASTVGYAEAENYRRTIESQGHIVGDDNTGSLGRLEVIHPHY